MGVIHEHGYQGIINRGFANLNSKCEHGRPGVDSNPFDWEWWSRIPPTKDVLDERPPTFARRNLLVWETWVSTAMCVCVSSRRAHSMTVTHSRCWGRAFPVPQDPPRLDVTRIGMRVGGIRQCRVKMEACYPRAVPSARPPRSRLRGMVRLHRYWHWGGRRMRTGMRMRLGVGVGVLR